MSNRATVGGSALGVVLGWNVANIGAIADELAVDYDVALVTVGLFTTAMFVTHALLQIPGGRTADRFGARRTGLLALVIIAAANALAMVDSEPALALSMRALVGVGTAFGFVAGSDYVREQSGSAFAQGLYGGIGLGGAGIALAVVPQVEGWAQWRAPYLTAFVLALLALVILAASPRDLPRRLGARRVPIRELLRDSRLFRIGVVYMASFGLSVIIANWVVTLLERAGGYDDQVAGAVGALTLLVGIVSRPLGGWLTRQYPDRARLLIAWSLATSALATALLVLAEPLALVAFAAFLLGLAAGLPFAPSFGAAAATRPEAPAAAVAMVNMAANMVIVIGTPLIGLTFSLPGDGRIGFALLAVLWVAALGALPASRRLALR